MLADPMKSEQASVNPHFLMIKIIRSTQFYRYVHRIYTRKCPFHSKRATTKKNVR